MRIKTVMPVCFLAISIAFAGCGWRPEVRHARPPVKRIVLHEEPEAKPPPSYVVHGVRYYPLPDADGYVETGKASWYGHPFHGRTTSNGETYDMYALTAAHKTLPFNTHVSVENPVNGKAIVVRINDRGPFVKGRIIDLSYAAASRIGLVEPGVAQVRVTALAPQIAVQTRPGERSSPVVEARDLRAGEFTVQVGAFLERKNATDLAERLGVIFDHVKVTVYVDPWERTLHRVRVSRSNSLDEAGKLEKKLVEMGFVGAFVVRI
jgi:rare lipoprotein A